MSARLRRDDPVRLNTAPQLGPATLCATRTQVPLQQYPLVKRR